MPEAKKNIRKAKVSTVSGKASAIKGRVKKDAEKKSSENYLTKRILVKAAVTGFKTEAEKTMRVMGYTVVSHKGWLVKKFPDGTIVKISEIRKVTPKRKLVRG